MFGPAVWVSVLVGKCAQSGGAELGRAGKVCPAESPLWTPLLLASGTGRGVRRSEVSVFGVDRWDVPDRVQYTRQERYESDEQIHAVV